MGTALIKNGTIVNEGKTFKGSIFIIDGRIERIISEGLSPLPPAEKTIDASGKIIIPGVIDEHVHFREPGLIHKADISTESMAAVAGGVTSFMDMPNTIPQAVTLKVLEEKFKTAAISSLANYSFYLGATNDNLEEITGADYGKICGIKVFMGSSTGNMLVSDPETLKNIFSYPGLLVAVHSEDENIIKPNIEKAIKQYGENIPISMHPLIRSAEACYSSTKTAVELAGRYNTRLHVLHVSTERELELFDATTPLAQKRITSEICVHHLVFSDNDYNSLGNLIKMNPAIKTENDRQALLQGLNSNRLDAVATDHAPHTFEEKQSGYFKAPSGSPMIQHSLASMLEFYHDGLLTLEKIVDKMCHAPAIIFKIHKRGFIREGYFADLAIVDMNSPWTVSTGNILYKCNWSPLSGKTFRSRVTHTLVNGNMVYAEGRFNTDFKGQRLVFNRDV